MIERPSERSGGHGGPGEPEHGGALLHETAAAPLARVLGALARLLVIATVVAVYLLILLFAPVVRATATHDTERLVDFVSRLSFSEALDSYPDAAMIVQVVEGHGETPGERLRWVSQHSRCIAGRLTPRELLAVDEAELNLERLGLAKGPS